MDFLKSCKTNVRLVEDTLQIKYSSCSIRDGGAGGSGEIIRTVADLRAHNVLCAAAKDEIWVFGQEQATLEDFLEAAQCDYIIRDTDVVVSNPGKPAADGRAVRDILLEAIEGSITYELAKQQGLIHVGAWTWLFTHEDDDTEDINVLVRLHVQLTEAGTLYVSTTTHVSSLRWLRELETHSEWTYVLLAPSGRVARLVSVGDCGDSGEVGKVKKAIGNSAWKLSITKFMTAEGVDIGPDEPWMTVDLRGQKFYDRVMWPARMCLTAKPVVHSKRTIPPKDWAYWFGGSNDTGDNFKNPLAVAEEWFQDAVEREKATVEAVDIFSVDGAGGPNNAAHTTNVVPESPLVTSPPFNQRIADHQAALSGIYPTPPDGLIPGHATQHIPSSDGASMQAHGENSAMSHDPLPGSDDDRARGRSLGSSNEAQGYQPHSDDLFGDMGEMDFGANEVGDADFDYFDEPDDMPQADAANGDVEMEDIVRDSRADQVGDQTNDELTPQDEAMGTALSPEGVPDPPQEASNAAEVTVVMDETSKPGRQIERDVNAPAEVRKEPEKPLSPFGIRERLLPPPIPASAAQSDAARSLHLRRSSTFDPVTFNEGLDLKSKYAATTILPFPTRANDRDDRGPATSLPQKRKKPRPKPSDPDSGLTDADTESEEDSYEDSDTSLSDDAEEDLPPRLPWDTKKRKRSLAPDQLRQLPGGMEETWEDEDDAFDRTREELSESRMGDILDSLLTSHYSSMHLELSPSGRKLDIGKTSRPKRITSDNVSILNHSTLMADLPPMGELFEISKLDLVYIAQVVSEQASSKVPQILSPIDKLALSFADSTATTSSLQILVEEAIAHILPNIDECDLTNLALLKEPPRQMSFNAGKAPQARPPQREGSMHIGPDYFPIPPAYVRVQRGADTWEMLPPALSFWSALGLGPASGHKDVRHICVVPRNEDLAGMAKEFLDQLGDAYESRKLGSFADAVDFSEELDDLPNFEDGLVLIGVEDEVLSTSAAMKAYAAACEELGRGLAKVGHLDPDRSLVIYMVNPFEHNRTDQYLCACFWMLYKAYRDHAPKGQRSVQRSDLVLQILHVSIIASSDGLTVLDAQQMGAIATETHDRCPPSPKAAMLDMGSSLPILAAPAVELASVPPKRVGFQLSADPPGDLLHEGSLLHLAYAISEDGLWLTVCWIDNTSRYQMTSSACLRGKSFYDVAKDVWEKTLDILAAREVTWRVFIVSNEEVDASVQTCWRALVATKSRKQVLHVTLLSVQAEPELQLTPPALPENVNAPSGQGTAGFLTPVTTPRGTNMTVSPDASNNAPPTPASSETAANVAENDPDAHLVDLTDESWGMLLSPSFTFLSTPSEQVPAGPVLANGVLFKRGDLHSSDSNGKLAALGVWLHWDIRIRVGGLVDEGPTWQAEATLREVLRMYRNLSLLSRVRSLENAFGADGEDGWGGNMPVHILGAMRGAEALNGFLA